LFFYTGTAEDTRAGAERDAGCGEEEGGGGEGEGDDDYIIIRR